jgi:hypothetical protein
MPAVAAETYFASRLWWCRLRFGILMWSTSLPLRRPAYADALLGCCALVFDGAPGRVAFVPAVQALSIPAAATKQKVRNRMSSRPPFTPNDFSLGGAPALFDRPTTAMLSSRFSLSGGSRWQ